MSIFEIVMLLCFGAAWPFSIYKSYYSKTNGSKSLVFLIVIMMGYFCGILHKIYHNYDVVVFFYGFNMFMVFIDTLIYLRNDKLDKLESKVELDEQTA